MAIEEEATVPEVKHNWQDEVPGAETDGSHPKTLTTTDSAPDINVNSFHNFAIQDGYLPIRSSDRSLNGTARQQWAELTLLGSEKLGRKWADPRDYKRIMEEVGFIDVTEKRFKQPLGTWPRDERLKELGMWVREDMMKILGAVKKVSTVVHGWESEELDLFLERMREDLRSKIVHAWTDMWVSPLLGYYYYDV